MLTDLKLKITSLQKKNNILLIKEYLKMYIDGNIRPRNIIIYYLIIIYLIKKKKVDF